MKIFEILEFNIEISNHSKPDLSLWVSSSTRLFFNFFLLVVYILNAMMTTMSMAPTIPMKMPMPMAILSSFFFCSKLTLVVMPRRYREKSRCTSTSLRKTPPNT